MAVLPARACSASGTASAAGWGRGGWRASPFCGDAGWLPLTTLLLSCVAAAGLPVVLLAGGWLQVRRDFFLLAIYLQGFLYVHVGPYLYASAHTPLPLDAY